MAEIKFKIKETTGVISESAKGWNKELNLISWNEKEPKYDEYVVDNKVEYTLYSFSSYIFD